MAKRTSFSTANPDVWARELGISRAAVDLYLASDVIDSHIDSFIWTRVFGYDLRRAHAPTWPPGTLFSQVDFPRIRAAAIGGATWVITTNPLVEEAERPHVLLRNLQRFAALIDTVADEFAIVRTYDEYRQARGAGKHGVFFGVQGGNALDANLACFDQIPDGQLLRVTLMHLTASKLGSTSVPTGDDGGLTAFGRAFVERLNEKKIFVDLAHASRRTFFDAVAVHDRSQPLVVTHTGVTGVCRHWRNLDDKQLRAIAATGGTVGIVFHSAYLGDGTFRGRAASVVDHIVHVAQTIGDDHVCLGSDWDGAIVTPRDMPTCLELPKLVQLLLDRGWRDTRIQKVLGGNFLRVLRHLRG